MDDADYIESIRRSRAEAVRFFSNMGKQERELWVAEEFLTEDATSMLKASMSAWVFGGMGSWNDMGFGGATQQEYEKVSEQLFDVLNEAIGVAASSTVRQSQ